MILANMTIYISHHVQVTFVKRIFLLHASKANDPINESKSNLLAKTHITQF